MSNAYQIQKSVPMKQNLKGEEFNKFFEQALAASLQKKGRLESDESLLEIMEKNGISKPELPKDLEEQIMPLLTSKYSRLEDNVQTRNACSACGACGLCVICGELNAGAVGAASACLISLAD